MPAKLKYSERKAMEEAISYPAKLASVAFSAARCIGEARRHAAEELARFVNLTNALDWLWRAAEGDSVEYERDLAALHPTLDSFDLPEDDHSLAVGKHDIAISSAMYIVDSGFVAVRDPEFALIAVRRGFQGACATVKRIYQDGRMMAENENAVQDEALRYLHALGGQPVRRDMFDSIPDYERGPVSPRYLANRRRQAVDDEDDET